jgi:hypothetical protein
MLSKKIAKRRAKFQWIQKMRKNPKRRRNTKRKVKRKA